MAEVNGMALEAAIRAIAGDKAYALIDKAYGILDSYEQQVRESVRVEAEIIYKDGFDAGYDMAHNAFYSDEQPAYGDELNQPLSDVIYLPDLSLDDSEPELPFCPATEEAANAMLEGCPVG